MDPDAGNKQLQNKVMFDIRYYFCRRGGENMHEMTKKTFELKYDQDTKIAYVEKVQDELTKNHREANNEVVTGFMPQILTDNGTPHKVMDPDAGNKQLQNKVMFDIRYYFCRRGGENMHEMTKKTFELKYDQDTKIAYVEKVQDELTKNHREANNEVLHTSSAQYAVLKTTLINCIQKTHHSGKQRYLNSTDCMNKCGIKMRPWDITLTKFL